MWDAVNKQAHSDDLTLQVIQNSLATGMIPLVQMADMLVNKKELEPQICKTMLADSIKAKTASIHHTLPREAEAKGDNSSTDMKKQYCYNKIPRHKDLLVMPHSGELHPLRKITLTACLVSGDPSMTKDWQDSIVTSSLLPYVRPQTNNTNVAGKNG
uniref:Uncharacterized protein n=1 Tax=Magallana gigas TaxID=29159 RepID=A0A8W8JE50_MAGGI